MNTTEILAQIKGRLPHTTQRLIGALGWEGALRFLREHGREGGRCVYFPVKYNPINGLFAGMSEEKANALLLEFAGQDVELGGPKKMLASERYQLMADDYKKRGFTKEMLEEKYKVPGRTVRWVLNKFDLQV